MKMTAYSNDRGIMVRCKKWLLVPVILCIIMFSYMLYNKTCMSTFNTGMPKNHLSYSIWPKFTVETKFSKEYFEEHCFKMADMKMEKFDDFVKKWSTINEPICRDLYQRFSSMFSVSKRNAPLILPVPFQSKVKMWLGGSEKLFQEIYKQQITHIENLVTREYNVFNPLREKRPIAKPDEPERIYIERLTTESKKSCDFCNYHNFTAEHVTRRIESKLSYTASNTFKLDKWHALFIMKQHHPLDWDKEHFMDLMDISLAWFSKVHNTDPSSKFPMIVWDMFPHAGASQIHPHTHGMLSPEKYHGVVEAWRRGGEEYYLQFGSNYFSDLVSVYSAMGLAVKHGNAVAFANIVPKKDHEIVIISDEPGESFYELIYYSLRAYIDDLEKICYSMGIGLPPMGTNKGVIPAYARIVTRGPVATVRTDMSSLELFTGSNVNTDPYKVIQAVRSSILLRHKSL